MNKAAMLACAAVFTTAGAAMATPSTAFEEQTLNFSFPLSPGSTVLAFDQFDSTGPAPGLTRELQKVTIMFDVTIGANITAENDSALQSDTFAVNLSGNATVDFGGLFGIALLNVSEFANPLPVAPTDGVAGSGDDFRDFGFVSDTDSGMAMSMAGLGAFIGMGTIDAMFNGSGGFSVSGSTDATLTIDNFMASGSATVRYDYKIIPGASTAALFGVAGIGGLRRRR